MRSIELLAPAKDLKCGMTAILSGADAVYIGGPSYGARVNAPNTLEDIRELCDFAHQYGARIHVALNTILNNRELDEARELAFELYDAGADALIIQDLGLLSRTTAPPTKSDFLKTRGSLRPCLPENSVLRKSGTSEQPQKT